jgi:hypothetical protein
MGLGVTRLSQEMHGWLILVNKVLNLLTWFPQKLENSSFERITVRHERSERELR